MAATASEDQVKQIVAALIKYGIRNPFMQAAILSIVQKETGFVLRPEIMTYTNPERIMFVWPKMFPTREAALPYVRNPEALANKVYGGKYGNAPDEGYKFRGRGYNGITFRGNYELYKKLTGLDIVNNPDLLNNPAAAAEVLAAYYAYNLKNSGGRLQKEEGITDAEAITDITKAVRVAMRVNAGWGTSVKGNIFKEGENRALTVAPAYYNAVRLLNPVELLKMNAEINRRAFGVLKSALKNKKKRRFIIAGGVVLVVGTGFLIYKLSK